MKRKKGLEGKLRRKNPAYVGFSIFGFSKVQIHEFDYIKKKLTKKAKLNQIDMDSIISKKKTEYFMKILKMK